MIYIFGNYNSQEIFWRKNCILEQKVFMEKITILVNENKVSIVMMG